MSALAFGIVCLQNPQIPIKAATGWTIFDMTMFVRQPESPNQHDEAPPELASAIVRYYNKEKLPLKADEDIIAMVVCSVSHNCCFTF